MKRISIILAMVLLFSFCPAVNTALAESAATYEEFADKEKLGIYEAWALLEDMDIEPDRRALIDAEFDALASCEGIFQQLDEDGKSYDGYIAEMEIFLRHGVPFCLIKYDNYLGELAEAQITPLDPESEQAKQGYLFHTAPDGTFYKSVDTFDIHIGPQQMHMSWGDGVCDYMLDRGTGAASQVGKPSVAFEDTEEYELLITTVDKMLGDFPHTCYFDDEGCTFNVLLMIHDGARFGIMSNAESMREPIDELIEVLLPVSEQLQTYVDACAPAKIHETGHCGITLVDSFTDDNVYYERDLIFSIFDGKLIYDFIEEVTGIGYKSNPVRPAAKPSPTPSATMGERNALQQAKRYLEVSPFSYEGLVEQLKYEGYTHKEAVYGADHCGADWNEQAAKKAARYLDIMAFSRDGLIDQLLYEGFTYEQAVYGVSRCGY